MGALALAVVLTAAPAALAERPLGIDVSSWCPLTQSEWNAIRNSGRTFAFARASYGWGYTDSEFVNHTTRGTAAGLYMGAYHFSYPGYSSGNTPINEATTFLNAAGSYITAGYLRPVLDVEYAPGPYMNGLTLTQWVNQWMDYVQAQTGVEPLIYTGAYFAQAYLEPSICSRDLWIAAWPPDPDPQTDNPAYLWQWSTWCFWQYAGDVTIPGVTNQKVDLDVFNGTPAQLQDFVITSGTPPAISRSPATLSPTVIAQSNAASQTFTVSNSGGGTLFYSITDDAAWLAVNPSSGTSTGESDTITVNYSTSTLNPGTYNATITITAFLASNSPQTIAVTLTVQPVPGDFNGDNHIDHGDVVVFRSCMTGEDVPQTAPNCQAEDLNHDGDVDQSDFGILQKCLSGPSVLADPNCAG